MAAAVEGVAFAGMKYSNITFLPRTIRGKLGLAFGVVATTAIFAGVVGHSSYEVVNEKFATITQLSLPSVVATQRIGEVTARIAAAVPDLHGARTATELDIQLKQLDAYLAMLKTSVEELAELSDDADRIRRLNVLAGQLAPLIEVQADNVEARLRLTGQSRTKVERLVDEHLRFNDAIKPTIEGETRAFSSSSREIIEATERSVDRLNQMSMKGLLPILMLRIEANNIARAIDAGHRAETQAMIDASWQSFVAANSVAVRQLGELEQNHALTGLFDVAPLRSAFSQFTSLGAGDANVFDRRREQLAATNGTRGRAPVAGELEERVASLAAELERSLNMMITLIRGRTATESVDLHQNVSGTLERMAAVGLGRIASLQKLEALGNQIVGILTVATLLETKAELETSRSIFSHTLEQMTSILEKHAGDQKIEQIGQSARQILRFGSGPEDMFTARAAELDAIARGEQLLAESLALVEELSATAAQIVRTTRDASADAAAAAVGSMATTRSTLFGAASAGLLTLLLVWLYARRSLVGPIRALQAGAARIGSGNLAERIDIRTGDELEALANEFNSMASQLQESYASLERKIEERTHEVSEALERQTATSEVLNVISRSPTDVQPVFEMIAQSAARLCGARFCNVFRLEGMLLHLVAHHGLEAEGIAALHNVWPMAPDRGSAAGRAVLSGGIEHIPDVAADPDYAFGRVASVVTFRSVLAVPMMREGTPIGAIVALRSRPGLFSDRQVELLKTFADQAVIAIENVRMFKELDSRNRELTKALERQTATSEVLKVMSRSQSQLQPVLEAIASTSIRLCQADYVHIYKLESDGNYYLVASKGVEEDYSRPLFGQPFSPSRGSLVGRAALERKTVHIPNILEDPDYTLRIAKQRTGLGVPLLRGEDPIGVIVLLRMAIKPFTASQIELVTTFADQAVIAIENVRLFDEVQGRTRELTRSVDELRALDEVSQALSSILDLETVLATIVSRAVDLSGSSGGVVYELDESDQVFVARAVHRISEEHLEALRATPIRMGEGAVGRAGLSRKPVEVTDIDGQIHLVAPQVRSILSREGMHALLAIPLVREGRVLGGLVMVRREAGAFSSEVIGLLRTFAAHSVLAIQNARLFREIEEKGLQLAEASRHKSQFLANMSHELRTPLNAILGYTELVLDDIYGKAPEKMREVLERIQSNGRHLLGLINDVLDLSKIEAGQLTLSLADYSLADILQSVRSVAEPLAAENGLDFRVEVPPNVPIGRGDERRLAQVLLNLVGNAIKFTDTGEVAIEVHAADGTLRIAVRDTGPGIAAADRERIFGEFQQADSSSTRKKGGTGLGLSISRRIIEMHGGRIDLDSSPGHGATFTVILPIVVEKQEGP